MAPAASTRGDGQRLADLVGRARRCRWCAASMVDRAVLGHGGRVVDRRRRVVDLGDGDVDGGRVGLGVGDAVGRAVVGDRVGEAVGAVVVGRRRVGHAVPPAMVTRCRGAGWATAVTVSVWAVSLAGPVAVVGAAGRWSTEPSSATVAVSSTAVGASLTSVTVTLTVAVSDWDRRRRWSCRCR